MILNFGLIKFKGCTDKSNGLQKGNHKCLIFFQPGFQMMICVCSWSLEKNIALIRFLPVNVKIILQRCCRNVVRVKGISALL